MRMAGQWILSLIFNIQMYVMMAVLAVYYTPLVFFSQEYVFRGIHAYCRWVRWSAHHIIGLRSEIRGTPPTGEVLIASKHQSFLDIIMITSAVPRPKFIMKRQILWTPIVGFYAKRMGCVAVDRGKRSQAIKKMVADVKSGAAEPGQLIIFPQGTRVAAGDVRPYKIGTGVLYRETGQPCVPAATNVGVFWKRHGIMRQPGLAVVEFLPPIDPDLSIEDFMEKLQDTVETHSNRLMAEAGFDTESKS